MNSKSCKKCYFYGNCSGNRKCDFFTPIDDAEDEKMLHKQVEDGREQFRDEWFCYTADY